jgi:hypothetical protein
VTAESFLSSIVEAAVGMVGFAGIIVAVRQRSISDWPTDQKLLLRMLLVASAATIAFALLPAVLAEAALPRSTIWRFASGVLVIWQIVIGDYRTRQFRAAAAVIPIPRMLLVWVALILVLQVLNLYLGTSWPYLLGVFGILGNGFVFFVILLLGNPATEGDAADDD